MQGSVGDNVELRDYIRDIPDFPKPGILFRDITPLLKDAAAFRAAVDRLVEYCEPLRLDAIVGIESRGFLLASPLAYCIRAPLIPVRKKGRLPFKTHTVSYDLEYGTDALQVHTDAISQGDRVIIIDDLLATGGTMSATARLVEQAGGQIAGLVALVELTDLNGRDQLKGYEIFSLIEY